MSSSTFSPCTPAHEKEGTLHWHRLSASLLTLQSTVDNLVAASFVWRHSAERHTFCILRTDVLLRSVEPLGIRVRLSSKRQSFGQQLSSMPSPKIYYYALGTMTSVYSPHSGRIQPSPRPEYWSKAVSKAGLGAKHSISREKEQ